MPTDDTHSRSRPSSYSSPSQLRRLELPGEAATRHSSGPLCAVGGALALVLVIDGIINSCKSGGDTALVTLRGSQV
jgi:hypothetical protein